MAKGGPRKNVQGQGQAMNRNGFTAGAGGFKSQGGKTAGNRSGSPTGNMSRFAYGRGSFVGSNAGRGGRSFAFQGRRK
jgi:hypothetical protein